MLRSKRFRPFEVIILVAVGLLLVTAAIVGAVLAITRDDWRILIASAGIGGLAAVYFLAAKRGRPL